MRDVLPLLDRRAAGGRSDRLATYFFRLLVAGLICWTFLLVFSAHVWQGPRPRTYGGDFSLNIAGAVVMSHGGNAYDESQIIATQDWYFARQGIATPHDKYTKLLTWQSYPPLFFWLLEPLTRIPFRIIGSIWVALLYLVMGLGCFCTLDYLGWRRRLVPTLLFLATPQVTLQAFSANPAALAFAAIGCALFLQKRYPVLGGVVLSLAWIKLQVAVPAILLIALFHVEDRRRLLYGLVAGTAGLFTVTLAATGVEPTLNWIKAVHGVSGIAGVQPNMVPLVGLYGGHAGATMQSVLEAVLLLGALAITGLCSRRWRGQSPVSPLRVGWLWAVWLVALPYAHFPEEMLLTLPVLALVGLDACRLLRAETLVTLSLLFGSLLFFFWQPFGIEMLSLPVIAVGAILFARSHADDDASALTRRDLALAVSA